MGEICLQLLFAHKVDSEEKQRVISGLHSRQVQRLYSWLEMLSVDFDVVIIDVELLDAVVDQLVDLHLVPGGLLPTHEVVDELALRLEGCLLFGLHIINISLCEA